VAARVGFQSATLRTEGTELTTESPRPTNQIICIDRSNKLYEERLLLLSHYLYYLYYIIYCIIISINIRNEYLIICFVLRHKFLDDAYVLHFPFGILGFHYFYLERDVWGLIYMFTLGLFGIGWLVDLFRMPWLVSGANKRLEDELRMMAEIREQLGMQPTTVIIRDYNYQQPPNGTGMQ